MEKNLARYFIAIVPPEPVYQELHRLKEHCFERYGTKGALRSPPHVTLHMPFLWHEEKENKLIESLRIFCLGQPVFELKMEGFGCFPPRVIFININLTNSLREFQKDLVRHCRMNLSLLNANHRQNAFHPHCTIAFRDLKKPKFNEAWQEFSEKKFEANLSCTEISVLKYDGRCWKVFNQLLLSKLDCTLKQDNGNKCN